MSVNVTSRLTSEDIRIEWLPCAVAPATHLQHLYFDAAVDGGTFQLWVNGEVTADITMTGTPATDVAAIQAALDALPNLSASEIVVAGAAITDITLTAAADGFYKITIYNDSLTQTVPNANEKLQTEVETQGSDWIVLSAQASSFNWEESTDLIDMTAISEEAATEVGVKRSLSFDISLFKAKEGWEHAIGANMNGLLWIFPEGKIVGKENYQFLALIESFGEDFPDHEKIEKSISGVRQGDWYIPPSTVYRG